MGDLAAIEMLPSDRYWFPRMSLIVYLNVFGREMCCLICIYLCLEVWLCMCCVNKFIHVNCVFT